MMWRAPLGIQRFIYHNFLSAGFTIHRGVPIGSPDLSPYFTVWAGYVQVLIPVVIPKFYIQSLLYIYMYDDNYVCLLFCNNHVLI
jgi:hypothetical protein